MKTIKQIADDLGVSKQAVYKRVKGRLHTEVLPYAHTVNGTMYLDEQGETLIKSDFLQDSLSEGAHTDAYTKNPTDAALIRLYERENELLRQQLQVKDEQIKGLQVMLLQEQVKHRPFWQRLLPAGKTING